MGFSCLAGRDSRASLGGRDSRATLAQDSRAFYVHYSGWEDQPSHVIVVVEVRKLLRHESRCACQKILRHDL